MKKYITILLILTINLFALQINNKKIENANSFIIELDVQNISNAFAKFDKKEFKFYKNPFKKSSYYALIAIPYYQKFDNYKISVTYIKNKQRVHNSIDIEVIDGKYKSEIIKVSKSKVTPNKKNQKRAKKERNEAIAIYNSTSPKLLWKKDFIHPIDTKVTSNFGNKRVYNNIIKSFHGGTDFRAAIGTPIKAVNDGIIKISKNRFYAGNSIVIDHGHGVYSCYYHLSKLHFKVGQKVKRGDIVGLSGNTGRVTGPHLHFSMWTNGILVDPMQLISTLNIIKK